MPKSLIRTLSFFSKWLAEIIREPALMLSLVLGPFLILLAFGAGTRIGAIPKPRTIVVSADTPQEQPLSITTDDISQYLIITSTTDDPEEALTKLRQGEADLVAVLPPNAEETVAQGEHAKVMIFTNEIDPLRNSYTNVYLYYQLSELNRNTIRQIIQQVQQSLVDANQVTAQARRYLDLLQGLQEDAAAARSQLRQTRVQIGPTIAQLSDLIGTAETLTPFVPGLGAWLEEARALQSALTDLQQEIERVDTRLGTATDERLSPEDLAEIERQLTEVERAVAQFRAIPPAVLSSPFTLELTNVAPFEPTTVGFYAPAVLTLLLQHLAVTLGALSMARVRLLGLMELLQTAPVRPIEVVIGNYLSYGLLCVVAAAVLAALLTFFLAVPVVGSVYVVAGLLLLLIASSLGIGFIISMISSSEQQAAQLAMLVLIASVFFGGFMIFLDAIDWPVRTISYILPATYAIRSLRDVMLKGVLSSEIDPVVLGAMSVLFFIVTLLLFRREFKAA